MICVRELVASHPLRYAPDMSILADNISLLVERAGGQDELAEMIGVTQPTVSRWAAGTVPRKLQSLGKAAEMAGVSINELMTVPIEEERLRPTPAKGQILLPVALPSEERLTVMMRALLRAVGLEAEADAHAETLAQRLPGALAQAASDLVSLEYEQETTPAAPSPRRAKRGHELQQ